MIGDRPNTDICFGKQAGVNTCLVMTGVVNGIDDFNNNWITMEGSEDFMPTHFMQSLGSFDKLSDK
jgi:ribonucleotide monophosphatase NagD (HAD superfamily)